MWLLKALLAAAASALVLSSTALAGPPPVRAGAYAVENGATGEILAAENESQQRAIASITKLMTVLVTLEHARLDEVVTVPAEVTTIGESTIYLQAGERMSVRDLVEAALIPSANDAADTLAYHVGRGSQARFVTMMNAKARRLGLSDTHFARPDGLDSPGHVSSARDVTKLARVLMRRRFVRGIVRDTSATIAGGRTIYTRNRLLYSYPGLIGVKTGHTSLAGWSEVAAARRNGVTIYATILGSPSEQQRDADLASLLTWGLSQYRSATVVSASGVYARAATGFGRGSVELVAPRQLVRPVRIGRPLVEKVIVPQALDLPVKRGQAVGQVRIYAGARLVGARPLVAARSVSAPGFAGRTGWYIGRTFSNIWGWVT
ncbi:MAG: D-alanyl-D-alanine carboxypeptidase [Actinobacteria bacterium]|nr:D-alanyl-D-alanine carboxypeptidase [Actinomycetota bacterium]